MPNGGTPCETSLRYVFYAFLLETCFWGVATQEAKNFARRPMLTCGLLPGSQMRMADVPQKVQCSATKMSLFHYPQYRSWRWTLESAITHKIILIVGVDGPLASTGMFKEGVPSLQQKTIISFYAFLPEARFFGAAREEQRILKRHLTGPAKETRRISRKQGDVQGGGCSARGPNHFL